MYSTKKFIFHVYMRYGDELNYTCQMDFGLDDGKLLGFSHCSITWMWDPPIEECVSEYRNYVLKS